MSKDQPFLPHPGDDERVIVEEMIRDLSNEHWGECYLFVKKAVHIRATNLPHHQLDDLVQEIMFKITKYLPHFLFQCAFTTWMNAIINNHIIDEYRKQRNEGSHLFLLVNLLDETEAESQEFGTSEGASTEETFELHELIRLGTEALQEYANTHSNSTRNRLIIQMVVFEGKTYEEAAKAAGCNSPVVGYVVREAQKHARNRWREYL